MGELAKRLGVFVIGNLIVWGAASMILNMLDGKDALGREKIQKTDKRTKVDWKGNVILGTDDYTVC